MSTYPTAAAPIGPTKRTRRFGDRKNIQRRAEQIGAAAETEHGPVDRPELLVIVLNLHLTAPGMLNNEKRGWTYPVGRLVGEPVDSEPMHLRSKMP